MTYVHGTDPVEQRRLSRMNDLLNEACVRELDLRGGERLLDVGAGLGQLTRAYARAAAHVIGVERDPVQLQEALRQAAEDGEASLVELRQGDATDLPLRAHEWGTFDVVHTRFLLEHVPDPLAVLRGMVRAARPGGRVVLADDDHEVLRLWPEPQGFAELWAAYMRTFSASGLDPLIGRRLVELLHQAGARPRRSTWIFFGSCAGSDTWDLVSTNLVQVLAGAREHVVARGGLDAAAFDDRMDVLGAWIRRPDAAVWYPMCWAEGRKA